MKYVKIKLQHILVLSLLVCSLLPKVYSQTSVGYNWKNVQIKGGGYVPAIIYSKAEKDLLYARTDVGGAFRWNAINKTWIPLTDRFTDGNNLGILSLAADPNDANRVYLATGLYSASWGSNGTFFSSKDKGTTWTKVNWTFKLGGNEAGRGSGERLQVDPNLGSILLMGSSKDGLWKSPDYGTTWTKINSFPASQITFVALDAASSAKGTATKDIYVGTSDHFPGNFVAGIYKSSDAGATWTLIPNQPTNLVKKSYAPANIDLVAVASRMAISGDNIYISFGNDLPPNCINGAVYKYNKKTGVWTNLTTAMLSSQGGYSGVTVHPTNPSIILISSIGRWYPWFDELHISIDGGATWNPIFLQSTSTKVMKAIFNTSSAPYVSNQIPHWISDVQIDPFNGNNAIFCTGYGLFMTGNLNQAFTNAATTWAFENNGLEETVPTELICPPTGAPLLSAIGDVTGFKHDDLTVSPVNGTYSTGQGTNTGIDFAEGSATKVVRVHSNGTTKGSYSVDGGSSWSYFAAQPAGITDGGKIAISADGKTIVWAPSGAPDSYSTNNGTSWTACTGLPGTLKPVSDRVNSNIFYAYSGTTGKVYKSIDGGKTFAATAATLPTIQSWEYSASIVSVFGKTGHIWITTGSGGLHFSTNGGTSFTKVSTVNAASKVTFGKPALGSSYPTVFIAGTVNAETGLFRSDDQAASWIKINDATQEYGRSYNCLAADRNTFGRLYIGTSRGILYGDVSITTSIADLNQPNKMEVYPNPFQQGIDIKTAGTFQYLFFDIIGNEVENGKGENSILAGESLKSGIYMVKIMNETGANFYKIIKN